MFWYDRRRPDRISQDLIDPLDRSDGRALANRTMHPITD
jgi:hypothetical protein